VRAASTPSIQWWCRDYITEHKKQTMAFIFFMWAWKLQKYLAIFFHKFYNNITFFIIMCNDTSDILVSVTYSSNILSRHIWLAFTATSVKSVTLSLVPISPLSNGNNCILSHKVLMSTNLLSPYAPWPVSANSSLSVLEHMTWVLSMLCRRM
jgi:hypothetical protein